jgi:hypothetical protein
MHLKKKNEARKYGMNQQNRVSFNEMTNQKGLQ